MRDLYASAYAVAYGADWLRRVAPDKKRVDWRKRRDRERDKRTSSGVAAVPEDELAYAYFGDLCDIAELHWPPLEPALGKREQTLPLLRRFDALRNTVAHSRELVPFEADLLSGIAGEIRQRVAIYMTGQDPSGEYFARIEAVTDNYGHRLIPEDSVGELETSVTLRVGDVVHFACRATDPQGRAMSWFLLVAPGGSPQVVDGSDAELRWTVEDAHVGQATAVHIDVTSDSAHHRIDGKRDGRVTFIYRVLPQ